MGGKSLEQEDTQKAGAMTQARDEQEVMRSRAEVMGRD